MLLIATDISAPKMELLESPDGRITNFPQGISLNDKNLRITAQKALFYERDNRALLFDSVNITTNNYLITSETLYYDFNTKTSQLLGNVILESDTLNINTPYLRFDHLQNIISTQKDITIKEKKQNLTITGNTAWYNLNKQLGVVESTPKLLIERQDTIIITSQKMAIDNQNTTYYAINKVAVEIHNAILSCDSLTFYIKEDYGVAMGNPFIKSHENYLSGEIIYFYFEKKENQESTTLSHLQVAHNAKAEYYTNNGGIVSVQGNNLMIIYEEAEINEIQIIGDSLNLVKGTYISEQEL